MSRCVWNSFVVTIVVIAITQAAAFTTRAYSGQPVTTFVVVFYLLLPMVTAFPASLLVFRQTEELRRALDELAIAHAELKHVATLDTMTGLLNRETFFASMREMRRKESPGILLLLDADNFKAVNDRFGHPEGDVALLKIATAIQASSRHDDIVGRVGGEEFAVYLPSTTMSDALRVAARIGEEVQRAEFCPLGLGPHLLTVSIGAALVNPETQIAASVREADRRLYEAKRRGRNNVVAYGGVRSISSALSAA